MADVQDANNFYENYAEDTKGKRKVAVDEYHSLHMDDGLNVPGLEARDAPVLAYIPYRASECPVEILRICSNVSFIFRFGVPQSRREQFTDRHNMSTTTMLQELRWTQCQRK